MDLRLRTQLYVIWLTDCWLHAVLIRLASTGHATLLSVQIVLQRFSIERTTGRELSVRIQS